MDSTPLNKHIDEAPPSYSDAQQYHPNQPLFSQYSQNDDQNPNKYIYSDQQHQYPPQQQPYQQPFQQPFINQALNQPNNYNFAPYPGQIFQQLSPDQPINITTQPSAWSTTFPLPMQPAYNVIDPIRNPKSTKLYQAMCQQFGSHNVIPLPQFLANSTDKSRTHWYKSDANAQLYFYHRSPKYKERIQKMMDYGICGPCTSGCYKKEVGNLTDYKSLHDFSVCGTFCMEGLFLYIPHLFFMNPCFSFTLPDQYGKFYPSPSTVPQAGCNCYQMIEFRKKFFKRLKKAGINVETPGDCCICMEYLCCKQCMHAQQVAVINYFYKSRYGYLFDKGNTTHTKLVQAFYESNPEWQQYYSHLVKNPLFFHKLVTKHGMPYAPLEDGTGYNDEESGGILSIFAGDKSYRTSQMSRETTEISHRPHMKMFKEWYRLDEAIAFHNNRWAGTHQIVGAISMQ